MGLQKDLIEKGFSIQKIKASDYQEILAFQNAWEAFTKLPKMEKEKIVYLMGAGYEFKGKGETFDEKENFHLKQNDYSRLTKLSSQLSPYAREVLGEYLLQGEKTFKIYQNLMYKMVEELQPLICTNGCHLEAEIPMSCRNWVQRSLLYLAGQDELATIADAHPDKGFITFASHASTTGLQYFNITTQAWEFLSIPYGSIVVMPGLQMQMLTDSQVKALWHRVLNSPAAIKDGRHAQVAFCDLDGQIKYNKDKHGSTQEKEFLFNYGIPHEEFMKQAA